MEPQQSEAHESEGTPAPNLLDYEGERERFTWAAARGLLDGLPEGQGLNVAHEALERHVGSAHRDRIAIRWLGAEGEREELSYDTLIALTRRFANVLDGLRIEPGDRVFSLMGSIPELFVTALGAVRHRAVFCPLASGTPRGAIESRLHGGEARVLVTTERLYEQKVKPLRDRLPNLEHIILVGERRGRADVAHCLDWRGLVDETEAAHVIPPTAPEEGALLYFAGHARSTSFLQDHDAVVVHHLVGRHVLDLHPGDVYLCTVEPGSLPATAYGILAPLTHGATVVLDGGPRDVERWLDVIEQERVRVWLTASSAVPWLMEGGHGVSWDRDLSALRLVSSVGTPLSAAAVRWSVGAFGRPILDTWWHPRAGGIAIANYRAMPVEPGSVGRPLPGVDAAIVRRGQDGSVEASCEPDMEGELAVRGDLPCMPRVDALGAGHVVGGWFLSGQRAWCDARGYFWVPGDGG